MANLDTPLLDELMQADGTNDLYIKPVTGVELLRRWSEAKQQLADGLANKTILNVVFSEAKERISRLSEKAIRAVYETYWDKYGDNFHNRKNWDLSWEQHEAYSDLSWSCQLNHAAGRIKRLQKRKLLIALPEIQNYLAVLAELVTLNDAVQALKPYIKKGRRPAENPTVKDMTNTGTCAICGHEQKLTAGKQLVHHGFEISDKRGNYFGQRIGTCFGVGYLPYEISNEANVAFAPVLQSELDFAKHALANVKKAKSFSRVEVKRENGVRTEVEVSYSAPTIEFTHLRESAINQATFRIEGIERDIERNQALIANWKRTPTYDEGQAGITFA